MCLFWRDGRTPRLVDGLVNLTMTQGAHDVLHVQGAFWTLWTELKLYLLSGCSSSPASRDAG